MHAYREHVCTHACPLVYFVYVHAESVCACTGPSVFKGFLVYSTYIFRYIAPTALGEGEEFTTAIFRVYHDNIYGLLQQYLE